MMVCLRNVSLALVITAVSGRPAVAKERMLRYCLLVFIVTQVEGGGDRVHGAAKIAVFAGFKYPTVLGSNRTIRGAYCYRAYMEL